MIREERNALLLLLLFTVAAGLFYLFVLKPVLLEVAEVAEPTPVAPGAQDAAAPDPEPEGDSSRKSKRRMVGLTAWFCDAVNGRPLPQARAQVLDIDDIADPSLSLSEDGRLQVEDLPPSISFGLLVECDGYQSRRFTRLRSRARSVIELGLVALEPLRSLSGRVRDADGAPVGECVVSLFPLAAPEPTPDPLRRAARLADGLLKNAVATTQTDAEGAYRLDDLAPGLYAAYALCRGYGGVLVPDLDLRSADRLLRLELMPARPVQGEVLRPPGVETITNGRLVAVEAVGPLTRTLSAAIAKLDSQGQYALVGLNAAPHFLFPAGDELAALGHGPRTLQIEDGALIPAAPALELEGRLVDPDRLAVAGALIEVRCSVPGAMLRRAVSDEEGRFRVKGLTEGAADLLVNKEGFAPHRISLALAPPRAGLDPIMLRPPAALAGRVSSAGLPVVGALIRCPAHELRTLTDVTGAYRLDGLPPGRLSISAEASGFARREKTLEVRLRGDNQLDFELQRGGRLRVLIKEGGEGGEPGDVPVANARVLAFEVGEDLSLLAPPIGAHSDSHGTALIQGLPAEGRFVLMAHAAGHAPTRSQTFELNERLLHSGVALTLRPGGSIDGFCKDPAETPIPGVRVVAVSTQSSELDRALLSLASPVAWSGADGRYRLSDLPPGILRLRAGRPGLYSMLSRPAPIEENTLLTHFDLELSPAADLAGRVLDQEGQPVGQARVGVHLQGEDEDGALPAELPFTTLTDASGRFHLFRPDADSLLLFAEVENRGRTEMVLDREAAPPFDLVLETP